MARIVAVAGGKPHYRPVNDSPSTEMPFIAQGIHLQWRELENGKHAEQSEKLHAIRGADF